MKKRDEKEGAFRKMLIEWHLAHNKRQMPWKGEKEPYKIWLSEIILQQTRVDQGLNYYKRFIEKYPSIEALAQAADDDVFKIWEGLGYYSRCRNLLVTARNIVDNYNGNFPADYETILQLKGVGPYTAAAIASFAYGLPHAVLDGNVYRVLSRYFGIETASDSTAGKKIFCDMAEKCLDKNAPGVYNQAIMDFGATICTPANPLCSSCVLNTECFAFKNNMIDRLPVKSKSLKIRKRWFTYFIIKMNGQVLLRKRTGKDIWENLHEFLLYESDGQQNWSTSLVADFLKDFAGMTIKDASEHAKTTVMSASYVQKLTHQTIHIRFIHINVNPGFKAPAGYAFLPEIALQSLAFPKTIAVYLDDYKTTGFQTALL